MRTRFLALAAIVVAMAAASGCGKTTPGLGNIVGRVKGTTGEIVYQCLVRAVSASEGTMVKETQTTEDGGFLLRNLPAGTALNLEFSKGGYMSQTREGFILERGERRDLGLIELEPNGDSVTIKGVITLE